MTTGYSVLTNGRKRSDHNCTPCCVSNVEYSKLQDMKFETLFNEIHVQLSKHIGWCNTKIIRGGMFDSCSATRHASAVIHGYCIGNHLRESQMQVF